MQRLFLFVIACFSFACGPKKKAVIPADRVFGVYHADHNIILELKKDSTATLVMNAPNPGDRAPDTRQGHFRFRGDSIFIYWEGFSWHNDPVKSRFVTKRKNSFFYIGRARYIKASQ